MGSGPVRRAPQVPNDRPAPSQPDGGPRRRHPPGGLFRHPGTPVISSLGWDRRAPVRRQAPVYGGHQVPRGLPTPHPQSVPLSLRRGLCSGQDRPRGGPLLGDARGQSARGGEAAAAPEAPPRAVSLEALEMDDQGRGDAFDVIVVGGGPGGSTAAWRLAVAGARPLVLDAAVFPRVKICAGWVTPAALADLEIDPEKYPLTIQPFTTCTLTFEGTRHETRWRRPASYGILRREFDHYLLERAAASGADVRGGLRVTDVCVRRDAVRVLTAQGEFEAPVVIGAGRSEEHTSELQSHSDLVCRLL